jgi:regulator of protease activity HflC (stomatin/prohibitin superfamily)
VKWIRFVVTGDLERKAIAASISARFPQMASDGNPVAWLRAQKVPAATTHRLTASAAPSGTMKALARRVIAEAAAGEDGNPADLVIAVDDLELHNIDQPEVVCDHFQRAMELEIEGRKLSQSAEQRLRTHIQLIRDRPRIPRIPHQGCHPPSSRPTTRRW